VDEEPPVVRMQGDALEGLITVRYADGTVLVFKLSETDLQLQP
jgi:hypothetical protein